MKTEWNCERCGQSGVVEHDEHAGVWPVFQMILENHSQRNEHCVFDENAIKVKILGKE